MRMDKKINMTTNAMNIHTVINLSDLPLIKVKKYIDSYTSQKVETIELSHCYNMLCTRYPELNIKYAFEDSVSNIGEIIEIQGKNTCLVIEKFQNQSDLYILCRFKCDCECLLQSVNLLLRKDPVVGIIHFIEFFKFCLALDSGNEVFKVAKPLKSEQAI